MRTAFSATVGRTYPDRAQLRRPPELRHHPHRLRPGQPLRRRHDPAPRTRWGIGGHGTDPRYRLRQARVPQLHGVHRRSSRVMAEEGRAEDRIKAHRRSRPSGRSTPASTRPRSDRTPRRSREPHPGGRPADHRRASEGNWRTPPTCSTSPSSRSVAGRWELDRSALRARRPTGPRSLATPKQPRPATRPGSASSNSSERGVSDLADDEADLTALIKNVGTIDGRGPDAVAARLAAILPDAVIDRLVGPRTVLATPTRGGRPVNDFNESIARRDRVTPPVRNATATWGGVGLHHRARAPYVPRRKGVDPAEAEARWNTVQSVVIPAIPLVTGLIGAIRGSWKAREKVTPVEDPYLGTRRADRRPLRSSPRAATSSRPRIGRETSAEGGKVEGVPRLLPSGQGAESGRRVRDGRSRRPPRPLLLSLPSVTLTTSAVGALRRTLL